MMTIEEIKRAAEAAIKARAPEMRVAVEMRQGPWLQVFKGDHGVQQQVSPDESAEDIAEKVDGLAGMIEVGEAQRAYVAEHGPTVSRATAEANGWHVYEGVHPWCFARENGGVRFTMPVEG